MLLPPPLVVFAENPPENPVPLAKVEDVSPFSDKVFDAEGLLQSLGIDGSEYDVEGEETAGDEDFKLPLLLLEPGLAIPLKLEPNLLLAFEETGELRTSLLALELFGQDCLMAEESESDEIEEFGDTREVVETTASPSSSSWRFNPFAKFLVFSCVTW